MSTVVLSKQDLIKILTQQLPELLEEEPALRSQLFQMLTNSFASRADMEEIRHDLNDFREETKERFDRVDQRFESLETLVATGFKNLVQQINRLGQRWGIQNEGLFRATMTTLLEDSFGVKVSRQHIGGEEFDIIISNGSHILIEVAASVKKNIVERLERKRKLYTKETGVEPTRFILAVATIHSHHAEALRQAGFDVIEPEEDL